MSDRVHPVINVADAEEHIEIEGEHWGHAYKVLTTMGRGGGRLGVNQTRLPPGRTAVPFHFHQSEDEVFFVLSGKGVLRYGDRLIELKPGDCISCPARTGIAHQIANPHDQDLVYLAIGINVDDEVCVYPDSGKVMVRSLKAVGRLEKTSYMDGESDDPEIFRLIFESNRKERR